MIRELLKATISVALTPVSVVADVVRIPLTGYNDDHPFKLTKALIENAARQVSKAVGDEK